MVNTNSNVSSSIFLKRSELPTNISAFKNDVNYISESKLQSWLKNNDYLSKDEVMMLLGNNNVVIAASPMTISEDDEIATLELLDKEVKDIKGEVKEIEDYISNELGNEITEKIEQSTESVKSWIENKNFLTEHQSLDEYAKTKDIDNINIWINKQNFATSNDINELKKWVEDNTAPASSVKDVNLSGYAKVKDVYTRSYIDTNYIPKYEIKQTFVSNDDVKKTYVSYDYGEKTYIKIVDAKNEFLSREDYRGIKKAATLNTLYKSLTLPEFKKLIEEDGIQLLDGFYVIKDNCLVMVKNNKIETVNFGKLGWFEDGDEQYDLF